jgi:phenylalanyl-tRNA synthetase alpha chain
VQDIKRETWVLTDEGNMYAAAGSPEGQLFFAIPAEGGIPREELQVSALLILYLEVPR